MRRFQVLSAPIYLTGCGALETIPIEPAMAPDQWCRTRPCIEWGGIVLDQPLGSFLVYLLAVLSVAVGVHFWNIRDGQRSRVWWGVALVVGGIAAAAAGTSYQAFGYELKCAGRERCLWTSWFEVVYMVLQNVSVACMAVAVAHSSLSVGNRSVLNSYAWINVVVHLFVTAYGVAVANPFLISFELLLLFSVPAMLIAFTLNGLRSVRRRSDLDIALFGAWCWLFATNATYYAYLLSGLTEYFWRDGAGFYFSENDVLHVGMIGWMLYLRFVVADRVRDSRC